MAEQEAPVVRGYIWKDGNRLVHSSARGSAGAVAAAMPYTAQQMKDKGWTIVPVEIRELPAEQAEQEE